MSNSNPKGSGSSTRVLDVMRDPTGQHKRDHDEKMQSHIDEDEFVEYCPFPNDKYIDENHWGNPLVTFLITKVCKPSRKVALDDTFNGFILIVIIIAGVLVGVQTYDGMEFDPTVNLIDFIVLICFCVECLLKIFAEGLAPWRFWTGK